MPHEKRDDARDEDPVSCQRQVKQRRSRGARPALAEGGDDAVGEDLLGLERLPVFEAAEIGDDS